ncbi:hypothetical protein CP533_5784 [Ophiocordyceps camponoti-saundersi (nom. inval.)]|nr:hypothetical protein CP533_5784 [Ophiocordyceps camponoti-saundersi (nom. inval.)]
MKPIVSAMHAWTCTVISIFAIVILSILAGLYSSGHEEFVGGREDPEDGKAVSSTIFTAVFVYIVCRQNTHLSTYPHEFAADQREYMQAFFVFCGFQGLLHVRERRRGSIALS